MIVVGHAHLPHTCLDGVESLRLATLAPATEVWLHRLAPGAESPPWRAAAQSVVVVSAGSGKLLLDEGPLRFAGPCTLRLPAQAGWCVVNLGAGPLELLLVQA